MGFEEVRSETSSAFSSFYVKGAGSQGSLSPFMLTLVTWLRLCLSVFPVKLFFPCPYCMSYLGRTHTSEEGWVTSLMDGCVSTSVIWNSSA